MPESWAARMQADQQALSAAKLWRTRKTLESAQRPQVALQQRAVVNFCSNDYLGLANNSRLMAAVSSAVNEWGVGAGASHLVCGHQAPHHELELVLADFVGAERALLFANGYMANLAICSALASKRDLVLQDRLNHASLIDGAQLSRALLKRYAHAKPQHAEVRLASVDFERCLIVTDGVFSMDGDCAPVSELKALADRNRGLLVVDDAHGFGVLGKSGRGSLESHGLVPRNNILMMGTLSKACGSYGAFVAGDSVYIDQLIQRARSYIYTTALPPAIASASIEAIHCIKEAGKTLRAQLRSRVERFKTRARQAGLELLASDTAIQPMLVGEEAKAVNLAEALLQQGFLVTAIRPPTVPPGTARLRFTLSAAHTEKQVDGLVAATALALERLND